MMAVRAGIEMVDRIMMIVVGYHQPVSNQWMSPLKHQSDYLPSSTIDSIRLSSHGCYGVSHKHAVQESEQAV